MVRVVGVEPTRIASQEPKGAVTLVKLCSFGLEGKDRFSQIVKIYLIARNFAGL